MDLASTWASWKSFFTLNKHMHLICLYYSTLENCLQQQATTTLLGFLPFLLFICVFLLKLIIYTQATIFFQVAEEQSVGIKQVPYKTYTNIFYYTFQFCSTLLPNISLYTLNLYTILYVLHSINYAVILLNIPQKE